MTDSRRALFRVLVAPVVCGWPAAAAGPSSQDGRPRGPLPPGYFPNVLLRTHEGKRVRFYDDLLKGKVVAINFMFTSCKVFCPRATTNLRKVQTELGSRLGRDVFMVSISVDPETDTPVVLQAYVAAHKIRPGWTFVTGEPKDIDRIRRKLGVWENDSDATQHTGILTYGNEVTGTWAAMPVIASPVKIARALTQRVVAHAALDRVSLDSAAVR